MATTVHLSGRQIEIWREKIYSRDPRQNSGYRYMREDLEGCPHFHEILISLDSRQQAPPLKAGLHYWPAGDIRSSELIQSSHTLADLIRIEGFKELGEFWIPELRDLNETHAYLSSLIPGYRDDRPTPWSARIIESITTALSGRLDAFLQARKIHLYSMTVRSNSKDGLVDSGLIPIWKWIKPKSYMVHKGGHWKPDLDVVLRDSRRWESEEQMHLLVRGVPEDHKERFIEGQVAYFL